MSGNKRAIAVRLQYQQFVASLGGPREIIVERGHPVDVGYGKPPKHSQFKKGICPNPAGRGKRRDLEVGEILDNVLNTNAEFRENRQSEESIPH